MTPLVQHFAVCPVLVQQVKHANVILAVAVHVKHSGQEAAVMWLQQEFAACDLLFRREA